MRCKFAESYLSKKNKFAESSMFWCKISRRNWVLKSLNFSQPVEEGETLHAYERNAASTYCSFNSMRKRGYRQLYSYFCAYKNHLKHHCLDNSTDFFVHIRIM